jgi:hypothetical protein
MFEERGGRGGGCATALAFVDRNTFPPAGSRYEISELRPLPSFQNLACIIITGGTSFLVRRSHPNAEIHQVRADINIFIVAPPYQSSWEVLGHFEKKCLDRAT